MKTQKILSYTKWCEENYNLKDDELSVEITNLLKENDDLIKSGETSEYLRGKAADIQIARQNGCKTLRELRLFENGRKCKIN